MGTNAAGVPRRPAMPQRDGCHQGMGAYQSPSLAAPHFQPNPAGLRALAARSEAGGAVASARAGPIRRCRRPATAGGRAQTRAFSRAKTPSQAPTSPRQENATFSDEVAALPRAIPFRACANSRVHCPRDSRGPAIVALGRRGRRGSGGTTCTRHENNKRAGGSGKNSPRRYGIAGSAFRAGHERKCLR